MSLYDNIDTPRSPENYTISDEGIELIKFFEGVELEAYQDTGGVWTIGVGHTKTTKPGMVITMEEAEALLRQDIKDAERAVKRYIEVDLYQCQYDALVSFTFNLGAGSLQKSTLRKLLNVSEYKEVATQLLRWIYDDGQKLNGLIRRRIAEGLMFDKKDWRDYEVIFQNMKN